MAISFGVWQYTSDDGTKVNIKIELVAGTAVNGAPPTGLSAEFPPARTKLRKIDYRLITGTGAARKRIPAVSNAQSNWTSATVPNITVGAGTYKAAGRVGEKRY